jgi:hypothetical protein
MEGGYVTSPAVYQGRVYFVGNLKIKAFLMVMDAKSGSPASSNVVAKENILSGSIKLNCTGCSITHNLFKYSQDAAGTNNLIGTPLFVGGTNPSTMAGYQLTSSSLGYRAATDGLDMGVGTFGAGPAPLAPPSNLRVN